MPLQMRFRTVALAAAALTLLQIAMTIFVSGRDILSGYTELFDWDSLHYEDIASNGYVSTIKKTSNMDVMSSGAITSKTNVAFFPAYPLTARWLATLTQMPIKIAMLVTSQLFAMAFWIYFLLLLRAFAISRRALLLCVGMMIAHPASFFLVAAYSESLFMTMLIGYVYWSNRDTAKARLVAAGHGFVMTLTRIHGLFASIYPLLRYGSIKKHSAGSFRLAALVTAASILGLISFFGYCELAFGHWDLYLRRQSSGWGIEPEYAFVFQEYFWSLLKIDERDLMDPNGISARLTTLTFWLLVLAGILEVFLRKKTIDRQGWRTRLPLWLMAFLFWYFYTASVINQELRSMVRYLLVPNALMLIAYAHLCTRLRHVPRALRIIFQIVVCAVIILSAVLQWRCIHVFTNGEWVA